MDERGLLDLLSQLDQLVARSSGQIDDDTSVRSPPNLVQAPHLLSVRSLTLCTRAVFSACSSPLISVSSPEEQMRDELMSAYSEERERLAAVAQQLEVSNKLLQAELADRRQLVGDCEREIRATVELVNQAKLLALGMNEQQQASSE